MLVEVQSLLTENKLKLKLGRYKTLVRDRFLGSMAHAVLLTRCLPPFGGKTSTSGVISVMSVRRLRPWHM